MESLRVLKRRALSLENYDELERAKEKECSSCTVYFVRRKLFTICVVSQCIMHWIHFENIRGFTYQKALLHTLLLLDFKISGSLEPILKWFADNPMKCNVNKCSLLVSKNSNNDTIKKAILIQIMWVVKNI